MAVFKCKMCGGALEIPENLTAATCGYCGTAQTLPRLDDERRANLYDRANHFRRNNEYDKAAGIYEQILTENSTDAEVYWSLVLCRYGIEYVEDPATCKRVPTVNRAQYISIYADEDYKSALQYADGLQRNIFEAEAKAIDEIQKGILAISQKEEPFDIFICYKETDSSGRRTHDSVLANDLYHQLTGEGFKVFFSRITLEDKLGTAYEPYIFAALNSAKVMVVLGTKPEYFNAVWVKNEWSRYLSLIKNGEKKILIPAYRDMDPYDLPEEFSHLQAQDMSKLGFMQDLIRGIKKIVSAETAGSAVKETVMVNSGNANTTALLKRAFMALEDGEWERANDFCEQVLNQDAECAQAYLGKLMANLQVKKQGELKDLETPFDSDTNYLKVLRFADEKLSSDLKGYIEYINERNENARMGGIYVRAIKLMSAAKAENAYKEAAQLFETLGSYKDSAALAQDCYERAETARKDAILDSALISSRMYADYSTAIDNLETIRGWKNSDALIDEYKSKIDELNVQAERERIEAQKRAKRNGIIALVLLAAIALVIGLVVFVNSVVIPNSKYNDAIELMEDGEYQKAIDVFTELDGYKDSADKIAECEKAIIEDIPEKQLDGLKDAKTGDVIKFGMYEQDNDTSNGKEEIEWQVLEVKDGKALVISKYALDCQKYNTSYTDVTWETCTLRQWLNNDFIDAAFSADERTMIPTVTVSVDKNPEYSTDPVNTTQDQVFLLSITESNKYFSSDSARECKPTAYAEANGAYEASNGNCCWWLRSPADLRFFAAVVDGGGYVNEDGGHVFRDNNAVRPAMWVELNS